MAIASAASAHATDDRPLQIDVQVSVTELAGSPPSSVDFDRRYSTVVRFADCQPNASGNCDSEVLLTLVDAAGRRRSGSGWMKLWKQAPPPAGEYREGEGVMAGYFTEVDDPGTWEVVAVARDRVSGQVVAATKRFALPAAPLRMVKNDASLCRGEETVVFYCRSGKRSISLCATPDVTLGSGYLRYRIGSPGRPPELEFPAQDTVPTQAFTYYQSSYAKGGSEQVQFRVDDYMYVLYSEHNVFGWNGNGVAVYRGDRRIDRVDCDEPEVDHLLWNLRNLGMPTAEYRDIGDAAN